MLKKQKILSISIVTVVLIAVVIVTLLITSLAETDGSKNTVPTTTTATITPIQKTTEETTTTKPTTTSTTTTISETTQKTTEKTTVAKTTESSTTMPKTVEIPDKLYCPDGSLKPLTYSAELSKKESDLAELDLSVYTTADGDEATYYRKSGYLWSVYYADTTIERGPTIEKDKQKDYAYNFAKNFIDMTNYTMFSRVDAYYESLYFSREAQSIRVGNQFDVSFLNGQISNLKYYDPTPCNKHFETFENVDVSQYDAQFENDLKDEFDCGPEDYVIDEKYFRVKDDEPYIVYIYQRTTLDHPLLERQEYLID